MGIDLELADCVEARDRLAACRASGPVCGHSPDCEAHLGGLIARAAAARPDAGDDPAEFRYRRFGDINDYMQLTGMGYRASPRDVPGDLAWRSQTIPGRTGIPAFKLETNDCWVVTVPEIEQALSAYASVPADLRHELETIRKWSDWLAWLTVARDHGGFVAE